MSKQEDAMNLARSLSFEKSLIYYDGPLLYFARDKEQQRFLAFYADDDDSARTSTYWNVKISDIECQRLLDGHLDIRTPFVEADGVLSYVENYETGEVLSAEFIGGGDLDPSCLPEPGVYLR